MESRTIYELFHSIVRSNPDKVAFQFKRDGTWHGVTWAEQRDAVARVARGLIAAGVGHGDKVSILASTRLEWLQCDTAIVSIGAVTVGIYHSSVPADCAYTANHSESHVLFVENDEQLAKIREVRADLPGIKRIVTFDGATNPAEGVSSWTDFLDGGRDVPAAELVRRGEAIAPDDLASLVYTSGTTGTPKGAMISHANLLFTAHTAAQVLIAEPHYKTLLFLPLAHVFARMIAYMCMRMALTIAFAEDMARIGENIREVRPHFILSVPRIYEKIREKVLARGERATGLKKTLFSWALDVGQRVTRLHVDQRPIPAWLALQHKIADRLVFSKIRDGLGGRLVWGVSGAAPLNPTVCEFFLGIGIKLIEGIGMTENTSMSNCNPLDRIKPGTVGPAVPGVEVRIAHDGEVLFRGANNMRGYYKNPEATAEAIDRDGWLHSGDIGEIDDDGYLKITDRKKDIIVTSGGKNVAPQRIERFLCESPYISQAVVYGDKRKYLSVLITIDEPNVRNWATSNGRNDRRGEALTCATDVQELIGGAVEAANSQLASYESVKKFRILPRDLSIESGELTPTLKIRRKVVYEKYGDLLDEMYRDAG